MTEPNHALNEWQLYKRNGLWYWQSWDDTKHQWIVSKGFNDYTKASRARDKMISEKKRGAKKGK